MDPNNPLYIHASDSLGMVLATKIFDGSGFYAWRSSMIIALKAKNKFGFLNGEVLQLARDSPDFSCWERCNAMISSWLLNAVTKEIAESFLLSGDARQIWIDLEARFSQSNGAYMYSIEKELSTISQSSDSISGFFTCIKCLWDEKDFMRNFPSCSCGLAEAVHKQNSDQRLLQFLMGLNESYSVIRGSILMMDPLPSIHQAYSLFIQEEKQRDINSTSKLLLDSSSLNVLSANAGSSGNSGASNSAANSGSSKGK